MDIRFVELMRLWAQVLTAAGCDDEAALPDHGGLVAMTWVPARFAGNRLSIPSTEPGTCARDRLANGAVRCGACWVRIPTWGRSLVAGRLLP